MDDSNPAPLAILLVKDGSRGDKLLYKFPYCDDGENAEGTSEQYEDASPNPYAYTDVENDPFMVSEKVSANISNSGHLIGFTDKMLSNLLAVKIELCDSRFELQINDVRFIGHPKIMDTSKKTSLQMFHLVFAVRACLSSEIRDGYYSLCQRLAVALHFMDSVNRYTTTQVNHMVACHEKATAKAVSEEPSSDPFDVIAGENDLGKDLTAIFRALSSSGQFNINLDYWFNVAFVMPHIVYSNLPIGAYFDFNRLTSGTQSLQPFMSVLLMKDRNQFQNTQFPLGNPTIKRIMRVTSASNTLNKIAGDADVTYQHLSDMVGHFVQWGMMRVIYPMCNKNQYVMSSKAIEIIAKHNLAKEYKQKFPESGKTVYDLLEELRVPLSQGDLINSASSESQRVEILFSLLWLLEKGLLCQVHKYIYISVPVRSDLQEAVAKRKARMRSRRTAETSSEASQENIADSPTECPNCSKRQGSCKDCLLKTGEVTLESFTYAEWFEKKKSFSFGSLLKNASTEREKQNVLMQAIILSYLFPGDTFEKLTDEMLKRQQNFNFSFYERKRLEQVTRNESEKDAKRKNREGGEKPRSSNESGEEKTKKNKRKVSWRCQLPEVLPDEPFDKAEQGPCLVESKKPSEESFTFEELLRRGFCSFLKSDEDSSSQSSYNNRTRGAGRKSGTSSFSPDDSDMSDISDSSRSDSSRRGNRRGNRSAAGKTNNEKEEILAMLRKASLTMAEIKAAMTLYGHFNSIITYEDLKNFVHLCDYFRGEHHLEEMMYATNLSRGQVMDVLDKFSLILCVVEGPATNYPVNVY